MPNMKMAVAVHNFMVQKDRQEVENPGCNCSGRIGPCLLGGGCLVDKFVYRARVAQETSEVETYTGLTFNSLKDRLYGHRSTFENKDHPNPNMLSPMCGI